MMAPTFYCDKCNSEVPNLLVTEEAWEAIERCLSNKSVVLAAAELQFYAKCEKNEAQKYIEHLLNCPYAWPLSNEDENILKVIDEAFRGISKPTHFTNYTHCDECHTHDRTLRRNSRTAAKRKDFGTAGWDPISFSSGEGFAYYIPVLARFALLPDLWRDDDWYGDQLLSHLSWDGEENKLLLISNAEQKMAVFSFLKHLEATRSRAINNHTSNGDLEQALSLWSIT